VSVESDVVTLVENLDFVVASAAHVVESNGVDVVEGSD
jgi:hypothetical protein